MTRGTLVYIGTEGAYCSEEFNGDMYLGGKGYNAVKTLTDCYSKETFTKQIINFKREYYGYLDGEFCNLHSINLAWVQDMRKDYIDRWFSDYLYILNDSNSALDIICRDKNEISLKPREILVLYFGEYYCLFNAKAQLIKGTEEAVLIYNNIERK